MFRTTREFHWQKGLFPQARPRMYEWLMTVLYGVIEGITEFLPISSTAHLILVEKMTGDVRPDLFNIVIQAGAVLAVVVIYWRRLLDLVIRFHEPQNLDYLLKCLCAFSITSVLGLLVVKAGFKLEDSNTLAVIAAIVLGGMLIFWAEGSVGKKAVTADTITWTVAIAVGLAQVVAAVFPGVSRSAATIMIALLMGSSRVASTEFSFLVGIPTMFAASGLHLWKEYKAHGFAMTSEMAHVAVGFVVSTIVAFVVVKWLLHYVRSHTFIPFAWYRLVLGAVLILWVLWGGFDR